MYLKQEEFIQLAILDDLQTENFLELLSTAIITKITSKNCNQKQCYALETLFPLNYPDIIYIEKNTGLTIRSSEITGTEAQDGTATDEVKDYIYEFDTITDDDVIMPNISDYEIREK